VRTRRLIDIPLELFDRLEADRRRLNWLIRNGYTPGIWRPWNPKIDRCRVDETNGGLVSVGKGGRPQIDAAMRKEKTINAEINKELSR
jgi:hypothetical protein